MLTVLSVLLVWCLIFFWAHQVCLLPLHWSTLLALWNAIHNLRTETHKAWRANGKGITETNPQVAHNKTFLTRLIWICSKIWRWCNFISLSSSWGFTSSEYLHYHAVVLLIPAVSHKGHCIAGTWQMYLNCPDNDVVQRKQVTHPSFSILSHL